MRVSIIIPTFRGARFLEGAIQSVLAQDYPDIELLVFDGGSEDGSAEIIRRYSANITYWTSQRDNGQSDAINQGFRRATGEILNWLCCDDRLEPGAISKVVERFKTDVSLTLVAGSARIRNEASGKISFWTPTEARIRQMPCVNPFPQPSTFLRKQSLEARGFYVREDLHYSMDFELWNYLNSRPNFKCALVDEVLSEAIISDGNKTSIGGLKVIRELDEIFRTYSRRKLIPLSLAYRFTRMPLDAAYSKRSPSSFFRLLTSPLWRLISAILNRLYGKEEVYLLSNEWRYFYSRSEQV